MTSNVLLRGGMMNPNMINTAIAYFERSSSRVVLLVCASILIGIGLLDLAAGPHVSLTVFYLLPIGLAGGFIGWRAGLGFSLAAVTVALLADLLHGHSYAHPAIAVWNTTTRLIAFSAVALLASALNRALREHDKLSQMDSLTGLKRSELFYELVSRQVGIAVRYDRPLTLAYLGVDNFKALNEEYGRRTGDSVLISIAQTLRQNLRETDIVARLGGDEFGIFFPETGADHAKATVEKVLNNLQDATDGWPITFTIGAVVCDHTSCTLDELIGRAEALMRSAKRSGSHNYELDVIEPQDLPAPTSQRTVD